MRDGAVKSLFVALVALALAVPAVAQAPGEGRPRRPRPRPRPRPRRPEPTRRGPRSTSSSRPAGTATTPQGRRDPFVSLQRPVRRGPGAEDAQAGDGGLPDPGSGPEGHREDDRRRHGVAQKSGYIAILLGADGKSYFVTTGQRLYDGLITAVDATSVTFRQEVTDPLSPAKTREVRKSLYASEEARQ